MTHVLKNSKIVPETYKMIKFNTAKLQEIIEKIYTLCHVKVSIFDNNLKEILFYPKMYTSFCALIRSKEEGNRTCIASDLQRLEEVKTTKKTKKYICPHGLTEIFAPIIVNDTVVGIMTLGQILPYDTSLEDIMKKVEYLNLSEKVVKESLENVERVSDKKLEASAFLVNACAQFVYYDHSINLVNDATVDRVVNYIDDHISDKITAETLCRHFYMSKVTLYNLFSNYFDTSVADYIRSKKLALAKKLIEENPAMQISEISDAVGIDANYLPKIFKKEFGYCPKKYQMKKIN